MTAMCRSRVRRDAFCKDVVYFQSEKIFGRSVIAAIHCSGPEVDPNATDPCSSFPNFDRPFRGRQSFSWHMEAEPRKIQGEPWTNRTEHMPTVKFEAHGFNVRRTVTGIDGQGKPIMQGGPEGTSIAWDGKDYPVQVPGGPAMTIAVERISDNRNHVTVKQNGKVTVKVISVVSKDGKTMTNSIDGVNEKGEKSHQLEFLEKQ